MEVVAKLVTISTNPYQGLKHRTSGAPLGIPQVTISTNPYQGLKHLD